MTMGMSQIATTFILWVALWIHLGCGYILVENGPLNWRWRVSFMYFERDGDGMATLEDMKNMRFHSSGPFETFILSIVSQRLVKLGHLEGTQKANLEEDLKKWWHEYLLWGEDEITVDEHTNRNEAAFTADKDNFIQRVRLYTEILGNLTDISGDGHVTKDEVVKFDDAVGYSYDGVNWQYDGLSRQIFHYFNHEDNPVEVAAMINYWKIYLTFKYALEPVNTEKLQQAIDGHIF